MRRLAAPLLLLGASGAVAQPPASPAPGAASRFTLDTPIEAIAADPRGKAVLDRIFPGLLEHPSYPDFKAMGLSAVAPLSDGRMTETSLKQAAAELAALR